MVSRFYCKKCGGLFDYAIFKVRGKQLSVVVCDCTKLVKWGKKVLLNETTAKPKQKVHNA